jgi:hypothetical protein
MVDIISALYPIPDIPPKKLKQAVQMWDYLLTLVERESVSTR